MDDVGHCDWQSECLHGHTFSTSTCRFHAKQTASKSIQPFFNLWSHFFVNISQTSVRALRCMQQIGFQPISCDWSFSICIHPFLVFSLLSFKKWTEEPDRATNKNESEEIFFHLRRSNSKNSCNALPGAFTCNEYAFSHHFSQTIP